MDNLDNKILQAASGQRAKAPRIYLGLMLNQVLLNLKIIPTLLNQKISGTSKTDEILLPRTLPFTLSLPFFSSTA